MNSKPVKSLGVSGSISLAIITAILLTYMYLLVVVRHDFALLDFVVLELLGFVALGLLIKAVLERRKS